MIVIWVGFLSLANGFYMPSNISIASDSSDAIGLDQFYRNPFYDSEMNNNNYGSMIDSDENLVQNGDFDYEISNSGTDDYGKFNELFDFFNKNSSDVLSGDYNNEDSDLEMDNQFFSYKPIAKRSPQNEVMMSSEFSLPRMNFNYGLINSPKQDNIDEDVITSFKHPKQLALIDFPENDIEGLFDNKPDRSKSKSEGDYSKKSYKSGPDEREESNFKDIVYQEKPMDIWNNFLSEIMTMNQKQKSRINQKEHIQVGKMGKRQGGDDVIFRNVTESLPKNNTSRFQKYMPFLFKNMELKKKQRKGQRASASNKMKNSSTNEDLKKALSSKQIRQCASNDLEVLNSIDEIHDIDDSNKALFKVYKQSDQPKDEFLTVRLFEHLNNPFPNLFREIPPPSVVANIVNKDVLRKSKNRILGKDNEFYEFKFKKVNTDPFPNLFFEKPKFEQEEFVIRKLPMKKPKSKNFK
ncbi:hypothetical protein LSTR_LSTR012765 [Laodelphax striatellus]|uniref:Uncharacterized protein n=1 Tax=Laodelphax striatellus TaxID=195883 RepID=A0A482X4F6_LAOST|nr:hypothetical protein LSTR_LSTR012765 [Laodelphax striatellus]